MGEILLGLFCVLVIVTVVGHGLWLLLAKIFSVLFDLNPTPHKQVRSVESPVTRRGKTCICCGEKVPAGDASCPACGLDMRSDVAAELRDLEAAAREIQVLLDAGHLERETCDKIYLAVEKRQQSLIDENRLVPSARAIIDPEEQAREQRRLLHILDQQLGSISDLANLKIEYKQRALKIFRQLPAGRLRALAPATLYNLARLLESVGLVSRALEVYETLVKAHSRTTLAARGALEAGKLAVRDNRKQLACWFLEQAIKHGLVGEAQAEAITLLRELDPEKAENLATASVVEVPVAIAEAMPVEVAPVNQADVAEVVPVSSLAPPVAPPTPVRVRRSLGEVLRVFMEEKNILWGEVVGGLLIVGCSVALVISLWHTLEKIPYFPFVIFATITSALFGGGLYTFSRWKLESTSRGVLIIASLLTPLNFSILAGLSRDIAAVWLDAGVAIVGLALLGWLLFRAGSILVHVAAPGTKPAPEILLVVAVLGASVCQLLMRWLFSVGIQDSLLYAVGLLPVIFQACCVIALLSRVGGDALERKQAFAVLRFLGITFFAAGITVGFVLSASRLAADHFALPMAVLAWPLFVGGLMLQRKRITNAGDLNFIPLTSAGMLFTGMAGMLLAIGVAWPVPFALLIVCVFNSVIFLRSAVVERFQQAAPAGLFALAVLWLVVTHLLLGGIALWAWQPVELWHAAISAESGFALAVLAAIVLAGAEALLRLGREGVVFARSAAVIAALALLIALGNAGHATGLAASTFAVCGAAALCTNIRWRQGRWTVAGLVVLLAGAYFGLRWWSPASSPFLSLATALLLHATADIAAALWLRRSRWRSELRTSYLRPLRRLAVAGTAAAPFAVVFASNWEQLELSSGLIAWLAVLWIILAWELRWPLLLGTAQIASAAAAVLACAAWLLVQPWVDDDPRELLEPRSLCTFVIGLGGVCLLWGIARLISERGDLAKSLFSAYEAAVDRVLLGALLVGQLIFTAWALVPGVLRELDGVNEQRLNFPMGYVDVLGWRAWTSLVLLLSALVVNLSKRTVQACAVGFLLAAITGTALTAALTTPSAAVATALRWHLTLACLVLSIAFWKRGHLLRLNGGGALLTPSFASGWRGLLMAGTVAPVLFLSLFAVRCRFANLVPAGPAADSIYAIPGATFGWFIPLAIIAGVLAGHGFVERLPRYIYCGGWILPLASATAYALDVYQIDIAIGTVDWVRILQIGGLVGALWGIGWVWIGKRVGVENDDGLTTIHLLPWLIGFGGLLVFAIVCLTNSQLSGVAGLTWVTETGSLLGWCTLVAFCASGVALFYVPDRVPKYLSPLAMIGVGTLAAVLLMACSVERLGGDGYRALLLGTAAYALAWSIAVCRRKPPANETSLSEVLFPVAAGALCLLLALGNATANEDHLWSAVAMTLLSGAAWRFAFAGRGEICAFLGSAFTVAVASLVFWFIQLGTPFNTWSLILAHIDLCIFGISALIWLRWRGAIYGKREVALPDTAFLAISLATTSWVVAARLIVALQQLTERPEAPPRFLLDLGNLDGWLAFVPIVLATLWYVRLVLPGLAVHGVAAAFLLLGVQLACGASFWDRGNWLAHHVLTMSWSAAALLMLAGCWAGNSLDAVGPLVWPIERRQRLARWLAALLPLHEGRLWVTVVGLLTVGMAVRGAWGDPARPYWPVAATLLVSFLMGVMAVWSRRQLFVCVAGLLVNVIGFVFWKVWIAEQSRLLSSAGLVSSFVYVQAICFGVAAALWFIIENALRQRTPPVLLGHTAVRFAHVAAFAGLQFVMIALGLGLAADAMRDRIDVSNALAWSAILAIVAANICALWDDSTVAAPIPHLYLCGLAAIGMALHQAELTPWSLGWHATWAVTAYVFGVVGLWRLAGSQSARTPLAHHLINSERSLNAVSAYLGGVLALATLWIVFSFESLFERSLATFCTALLTLTAWQLGERRGRSHMPYWQSWSKVFGYAVLWLGVLFLAEFGWAGLRLDLPAPWLQRSATLFCSIVVAQAILTWGGGSWLSFLNRQTGMSAPRQTGRILVLMAVALVAAILAQEFVLYDRATGQTPLLRITFENSTFHLLAWLTAAAILALLVEAVLFALLPGREPFGWSGARLQIYAYAAEVLFVLCLLHVRLNVPGFFPAVGPYWTMVIMGVAFIGVGLSEILARRNIDVFAAPLRRTGMVLPLIPALAFLVRGSTATLRELGDRIRLPGTHALIDYLDRLPNDYGLHALVWFLFGLLYFVLAITRQSKNFALVGALAANLGLWVIFGHHQGLEFVLHPQLWLIPIGLIVLAAEQVNRDRLTPQQSLSVRYFGLTLIYVSSAADMFITGLGQSILLPIALALLSVLGVFIGIALRITAFLYTGIAFLLLVIFAQIWHAAVDREQTWVWWASGIVLGAAILIVFSVFEKYRNEVLRMVDDMKHWD